MLTDFAGVDLAGVDLAGVDLAGVDWWGVALAALAIALGGVLKGATGAGAPIVAVPLLAMLYDVQFAVTVFAVPNLLSNLWQGWSFRRARLPAAFIVTFAAGGGVGAMIGTVMLASLAPELLLLMTAGAVFVYIAFRMMRPGWTLRYPLAVALAGPVGVLAGVLQGASGVSAPVSLSFLNAMKLERATFIATVSVFFAGVTALQLVPLVGYGFMTPLRFALGLGALAVIAGFMPLGALAARHISRETFDRVILALLAVIAVRLVMTAI
jgi:uncharacterized membrane protein YfcA